MGQPLKAVWVMTPPRPPTPKIRHSLMHDTHCTQTQRKRIMAQVVDDPVGLHGVDVLQELEADQAQRHDLVMAVRAGDLPAVEALVAGDPSLVHHTLNRKTTLLVLAVEGGHHALTDYLIQRGVPVNKACHARLSALHRAASLPDAQGVPLIRLLVRHGAKLNPSNAHNFGWLTPLHEAVERRRVENARLLVELGSDLTSRDGRNLRALDLCGEHSAMAKAIRQGAATRWVKETMRRLYLLSATNAAPAPGAAAAAAAAGGGGSGVNGNEKSTAEKTREKASKPHWRVARERKGKPLPALHFCGLEEAEQEAGKKKKKRTKSEASQAQTARLLQGVFVSLPQDLRRAVVVLV